MAILIQLAKKTRQMNPILRQQLGLLVLSVELACSALFTKKPNEIGKAQ